ncbi:NUDIX domain-containing protein [Streptomyces sp. NPDC002588]|uniref:NUDIX hydrolase n=1 Tax=Streptomyces sp. NPDC002588 TaxID=3154419 RepID=UPI00332B6F5F
MPERPVGADEPVYRPTARVLLLDESDRLLMFSSKDDRDGHTFWYPVGGGCEEGETFEQAAVREVFEETGLTRIVLGPAVWRRRRTASWGGRTYDCDERYFTARVTAFDVDTGGFTEMERSSVVSIRWWTLDELGATTDRLVPGRLHRHLAELLAEGPPREPVVLKS